MFETVAPEAFAKRKRFIFYESLPLSIAIHALAAGAVAVAALARVSFPAVPPRLVIGYALTQEPPPPPPPPPPPRASAPVAQPAPVPTEIVAPTVIPDLVPQVPQVASVEPPPPGPVTGGVEGGVEGGVIGGDPDVGVLGGVIHSEPKVMGGILGDDGRVHFKRDDKLPMYIERQDAPVYPEDGRVRREEDDVLIRYVIGKDGRIKEVIVMQHPQKKYFEAATLEALRNWRFRPLVVDGLAREVEHELMVQFRLK